MRIWGEMENKNQTKKEYIVSKYEYNQHAHAFLDNANINLSVKNTFGHRIWGEMCFIVMKTMSQCKKP